MSRNTVFRLFEAAIPSEVCDFIVQEGKALQANDAQVRESDGVDTVREGARRTQVAFWQANYWVNGLLEHHIRMANKELWDYHVSITQGVQFGIYGPGDMYGWHKDEFDKPFGQKATPAWRGQARKVSAVLNLTDPKDYTGGGLKFKNLHGQIVGGPDFDARLEKKGSLVVFPAYVLHTVEPVETGERCSLVSWMLGDPFR